MKVMVNATPVNQKAAPKKKLVLPANTTSGMDTYDLKQIFRANALQELAGMDVTKLTPEVQAKLDVALTKTEAQLGQTLADTVKQTMFNDTFSSIQYKAEEISEGEGNEGQQELAKSSPDSLMPCDD